MGWRMHCQRKQIYPVVVVLVVLFYGIRVCVCTNICMYRTLYYNNVMPYSLNTNTIRPTGKPKLLTSNNIISNLYTYAHIYTCKYTHTYANDQVQKRGCPRKWVFTAEMFLFDHAAGVWHLTVLTKIPVFYFVLCSRRSRLVLREGMVLFITHVPVRVLARCY